MIFTLTKEEQSAIYSLLDKLGMRLERPERRKLYRLRDKFLSAKVLSLKPVQRKLLKVLFTQVQAMRGVSAPVKDLFRSIRDKLYAGEGNTEFEGTPASLDLKEVIRK